MIFMAFLPAEFNGSHELAVAWTIEQDHIRREAGTCAAAIPLRAS
jgi:hypothetical protein